MPNFGKSGSETTQQQASTTAPWAPTQGILGQILSGLGQSTGQYQPTGAETGALNQIQQNAAGIPNFGQQATALTNSLFAGGGANQLQPMVNDAYSQYQQQLSPYANGQNLDPTQAPGMQNLLNTIRSDTSNSVNGMFAGAGRDLSGANSQALARGISQGEAQPLLNQYNQNVQNQLSAAGSLYGAGGQTAGLLSGLQQTGLGNQATGIQTAAAIPGLTNMAPQSILDAAQQQRNLPLSNLGNILNLLLPIAGLGGQTTGQGTSQTNNTMSGAQQFGIIASGLGSLFGGLNPGKSDRRLKEDILETGEDADGKRFYSFRYYDGDEIHLGLMADEVEKYAPEAVLEGYFGFKMVDYAKLYAGAQ